MWLLTASIIVFIIVIALIIYANRPPTNQPCGCNAPQCPKCPCNKCGMPKGRCGCQRAGGCSFC